MFSTSCVAVPLRPAERFLSNVTLCCASIASSIESVLFAPTTIISGKSLDVSIGVVTVPFTSSPFTLMMSSSSDSVRSGASLDSWGSVLDTDVLFMRVNVMTGVASTPTTPTV